MADDTTQNNIQIDLSEIDQPFQSFIKKTIRNANKIGVSVLLSSGRYLYYDDDNPNSACNGYFDDEEQEFGVACGQPFKDWIITFIHESCHVDQWVEEDDNFMGGTIGSVIRAYDLLDLWLNHNIELTGKQLDEVIKKTMIVELDCERRAIRKIKKYKLPINTRDYARRANAYVYFYFSMKYSREWYKIDEEPYSFPEILDAMPTSLSGKYDKIPKKHITLILKHLHPKTYKELLQGVNHAK